MSYFKALFFKESAIYCAETHNITKKIPSKACLNLYLTFNKLKTKQHVFSRKFKKSRCNTSNCNGCFSRSPKIRCSTPFRS